MGNYLNLSSGNYINTQMIDNGQSNIQSNFTINLLVKPDRNVHRFYNQSTSGYDCTYTNSYILGSSIQLNSSVTGVTLVVGKDAILVGSHRGDYAPFLASVKCTINDWSWVTIVVSNNTPYIYLNGQLLKNGNKCSNTPLVPPDQIFSKTWVDSSSQFKGGIAEYSLWNKALSTEEMQDLFTYKITGDEENLIYHYGLREGTGSEIMETKTGTVNDISINTWGTGALTLKDRYHFLYLLNDDGDIKTLNVSFESITLDQLPIKYITDSIGGNNLNEVEIEVFDQNNVNVAKNRPVTYTGVLENKYNDITRVTDGNKESAQYVGLGGNGERSMTIELSEPTLLSKIVVYHYYADSRTYYKPNVTVSPDGITWYTVYNGIEYTESSTGKTHTLSEIKVDKINNAELVDVCSEAELTVDTFKTYGIERKLLFLLNDFRYSLNSNTPKILYHTLEPTVVYYKEKGIPLGEIIEMNEAVNLSHSYINYIRNITITANVGIGDVLKFIISNDGQKWLTFYEGEWVEILKNKQVIIDKGMDLETLNGLSELQLQSISENVEGVKLAWYMKKSTLNSNLSISEINMEYSTRL